MFLLLLTVFSCSDKKQKNPPENVFSEEKMIEIIFDIQLIEGAVAKKIIDKNVRLKESPLYYQKVFEKHNITKEQYEESISYYTKNPKKLSEIYDKVLVRLSTQKAQLQKAKLKK